MPPLHGPPPPIPLTILTGFLGAGKTTLLNGLLRHPNWAETLVIINEFGAIGIDHHLIETADDSMILLKSGCLCCTIRGDLMTLLEDLLRRKDNGRIAPFKRVVIETTGLADPAPILGAILAHPYIARRYQLERIIAVVDAHAGIETLEHHPEAQRQVAMADVIALSKLDLLPGAATESMSQLLQSLNPFAPQMPTQHVLDQASMDNLPGFTPASKSIKARWTLAKAMSAPPEIPHNHDINLHGRRIQATTLSTRQPIGLGALETFLGALKESFGTQTLRLKGLVLTIEDPATPVLVQASRHAMAPLTRLEIWPENDRQTRLVFILEDLDSASLRLFCAAFFESMEA